MPRGSVPSAGGPEGRHPRAGTGTGYWHHGGYYGYPHYGYPYYGGYGYYGYPYYGGWYFGLGYGYGYPSYGYPVYGYPAEGYGYRPAGSLRLQIHPSKARVYVDGYFAGIVDDYDGMFQKLYVRPGRHEITLRYEGYRTQVFRVFVPFDDTVKIHFDMVKGSGQDVNEDFAAPPPGYDPAEYSRGDEGAMTRRQPAEPSGEATMSRREAQERRDLEVEREDDEAEGDGGLRLQVRPEDASVYVDGEFRGTGRETRELDLTPGRHKVEVVRPGYRTQERDVEVERDAPTSLTIELEH